MLVRPDGSMLNKQEVLQNLRSSGLRFHSIELGQTEVRMYGSTAVLTAESQAVSSRYGMESRSHFRVIAVYVQQGQSIKLVDFQSTFLRSGALSETSKTYWHFQEKSGGTIERPKSQFAC